MSFLVNDIRQHLTLIVSLLCDFAHLVRWCLPDLCTVRLLWCCCSVTKSFLTLWNPMDCSTPGFTISQSLLKLMSIELVMLSNHLIFCHPLHILPWSWLTLCNPMDYIAIRLLCPPDSPGKDTEMDCHFLLQGIFPTQGWNPGLLWLLHWETDSLPLSH